MNVDRRPDPALHPEVFERYDMRMALARRDVAAVFRILQKHGISQRRIASLTGQSQSEISEIMSGRQVMAYDVLVRVADGLGVRRGYLGLGYDGTTEALLEAESPRPNGRGEDPQQLVARAVQVALGAALLDPQTWWQPFERSPTPDRTRVEAADVERVEIVTAELRALDNRIGGGACREAIVAHAQAAQRMLRAAMTDAVAGRLHVALADLQTLAGLATADMGLQTPATLHFGRALEQARHAGELSLVAKVLYCTARTRLQAGKAVEALRLLGIGQIAAQESGHPLAVALIAANEALVYGTLGECRKAEDGLLRARDRLGEFGSGRFVPPWLTLMDEAELSSLAGATYAGLSNRDQLATAVGSLQTSLALRHSRLVRSRTLDTILLADVLFAMGDVEVAARVATQALDLAEHVRSSWVDARLDGLRKTAVLHSDHPDVPELVERLDALQT